MITVARHSLVVLAALLAAAPAHAQSGLSYSRIDRATVRVFAIRGVGTISLPSRGGYPRPIAVPEAGHGSGVVIAREGVILTAHHVVKDARLLAVQRPGSQQAVAARVIYADEAADFALLSASGTFDDFVPIPTEPVSLAIRQTVHAIGYPIDPSRTTPQSSRGIVSGEMPDGTMQLDISVNPGNSGGPLVDEGERLLGIVVARGDPTQGVVGIGVAVPIARIRPAWDTMRGAYRPAPASADDRAVADLVGELVRVGAAGLFDEILRLLDDPNGGELVRRLSSVADPDAPADLLAIAAGYFWDWSQVVLERAGAASPPDLPAGRERELSWRLMRAAVMRCQHAQRVDPSIVERSPFVGYVVRYFGSEPPSEEVPDRLFVASSAAGPGSPYAQPPPAGGPVRPLGGDEEDRASLLRWYFGIGAPRFELSGDDLAFSLDTDVVLLRRGDAGVHLSPVVGMFTVFAGISGRTHMIFGVSLGLRLRLGESGLVASAAYAPGYLVDLRGNSGFAWAGAHLRLGAVFGGVGLGAGLRLSHLAGSSTVAIPHVYFAWTYD